MPVYDDQKPTHDSHDYPLVGGDPRFGDKKKKSLDEDELKAAENAGGESSGGAIGSKEESLIGGGQLGKGFNDKDTSGSFLSTKRFSFGKWTRKKSAAVAVTVAVGGGGIFGLSVLQGPFQFVHFAQMLQKFHLQKNEDFGDSRTSKILLYSLAGKGAQNGRLGVKGNIAANAWEKRLLERTGMRPVYSESTRRFVGFEIVDENKALNSLLSAGNQKGFNAKRLEQTMGKGAEIRTGKEVRDGGSYRPVSPDGTALKADAKMVDLTGVNFNDRRAWIRAIGQSTDTWRISSSIGSRLLIKRAGVDFHPMNKLKDRLDSSADSRKTAQAAEEEIDEEREKAITNGVEVPDGVEAGKSQDDNGDGTPDSSTAEDENLSNETKELLDDFKKTGALKTGISAAAIAGALCAAKSYGDGIQQYRFDNNILPMMRLGMNAVATGNQVMSNDDFDMASLKVSSKYLYDKEKKTSWSAAASVRAEQGKTGGTPMPPEADLSTAGGKPKLFRILDQVPGLGTTCSVQNAIFNLPGIKQVSGLISDITSGALDAALSPLGTDTDKLLLSSMKTISGKSVDPNAKGADFGNLANTGTFLAANDQAISMGGAAMSQQSAMEIKESQNAFEKQDQQTRSIAERYFNPENDSSLFAKMIDSSPNVSGFASGFTDSIKILSPGKLFGSLPIFNKKVMAASNYDYGVPEYGFTVDEQKNDKFENPYDNAVIVEPQLDDLNNKYGECFNMKITVDDAGPHIESGKSVNSFDITGKANCKSSSEEFLRYRFYIADVVNTLSIACYEGDEPACVEVGISGSAGAGEGSGDASAISGDAKTLAQQILDNDDITKQPNPKSSLEAAAKGEKSPSGVDQCGKQQDPVALDPKLLGFLAELGTQDSFTITSLTTGAHSCSSNHYKGAAVDFGCDLDTSKADKVGKKYGISHNFENCANDAHWHYSIGGS